MSEQTYMRIVQIIVLPFFVLGLIYADPFPPASAQAPAKRDDRHVSDCATLAGIAKARCERSSAEAAWRERTQAPEAGMARLRAETAELPVLRERLVAFESGAMMVDMGRRLMSLQAANDALAVAARRTDELEGKLAALSEEMPAMRAGRDQLARERDALERVLLASNECASECDGQCGACERSLQQRCVLCVGGRTALVSQYRSLAERLGIRLVHRDGGQDEAISGLPDMINGADAGICPTDCVSHPAYHLSKRHRKRTGKPCPLFKGAGHPFGRNGALANRSACCELFDELSLP